jgi:hypothetical protein
MSSILPTLPLIERKRVKLMLREPPHRLRHRHAFRAASQEVAHDGLRLGLRGLAAQEAQKLIRLRVALGADPGSL